MKTNAKSINIGITCSKITLSHPSTKDSANTYNEVLAIAILLGGYNQYGRAIPLEQYEAIKERFEECIFDVKELLNK